MGYDWLKPNLRYLRNAPLVGLLAGAAVTLPFLASSFRNDRKYNPENEAIPPELTAPLPPVLDFTAAGPEQPSTLMGMTPVEGDLARRVKMQRMGMAAAPDVTPPNILTPNGTNIIDGGKYVADLNKEASIPQTTMAI